MNLWIRLVNGLFVIAVNGCTKRQPEQNQRDVSNWIERREPVYSSAFDMLLINPSSSSFRLTLHTTCQPKKKARRNETPRWKVGRLDVAVLHVGTAKSMSQHEILSLTTSTLTQTWNEIWQRIAQVRKNFTVCRVTRCPPKWSLK